MKTCTKCGESKAKTEFVKNASKGDGFSSGCKDCARIASAKYYAKNKEKCLAACAKYRAENPDAVRSASSAYIAGNKEKLKESRKKYKSDNKNKTRQYYEDNIDKIKVRSAEYYALNKEKVRAVNIKWAADNPEKISASRTKWAAANQEKARAICAKWAAENPELRRIHSQNRRARKREAGGKLSSDLAERLFKLQRGKCACGCGLPLSDDFHLDHRMPLALGGANEDWNMQLLTATCNLRKGMKHPIDFMQSKGFLL